MLVDLGLDDGPDLFADGATSGEALGYDAIWAAEVGHNPFMSIAAAAAGTKRVQLGSALCVALARNPMTLATDANDLQLMTKGRFLLGLGSQIKLHIEKRYSMPWSHPADRMKEMIEAVRAIWASWETGDRLAFQGEFYQHTLMTPMFSPGPNPYGNPPIILAAVGPRMTAVAASVGDGVLVHSFTTERYLREVTMPQVQRGLDLAGKARSAIQVAAPILLATGDSEEELVSGIERVKRVIAFYGSTPAYHKVFDLHGWGGLGDEISALSKTGDWAQMPDLIDDEVLNTFAIVGAPEQLPQLFEQRFGGILDRVLIYAPPAIDPARWSAVLDDFQAYPQPYTPPSLVVHE